MFKYLCILSAVACFAEEPDVAKVSEAMGHLIGKNLQSIGVGVDLDAVIQGIKDAAQGKKPPLNEEECVQALGVLQEEALLKQQTQKAKEAESFLAKNKQIEGVVALEENKLQYKIDRAGNGPSAELSSEPLLSFKVYGLDGHLIGESEGEEVMTLEDTLPGFSKGVVGMHEGEKRTLYIHPDLGQPQEGLCICEVELIKADAAKERPMPNLEGLEATF